jgi:hypothetical protein
LWLQTFDSGSLCGFDRVQLLESVEAFAGCESLVLQTQRCVLCIATLAVCFVLLLASFCFCKLPLELLQARLLRA